MYRIAHEEQYIVRYIKCAGHTEIFITLNYNLDLISRPLCVKSKNLDIKERNIN